MPSAREVMERAIAIWNARDESAWLKLFGPESELELPGDIRASGVEAGQLLYSLWQDAFPDNHLEPQRLIGEGDSVVLESIFVGTQSGPLNLPSSPIPATNKHARVRYVVVASSNADRFARLAFYYDQVDILVQLGLMPAPAPA
jgi:predicted ester cyclase